MPEWKQERPGWCLHTDCKFRRRVTDALCGGELPTPVQHDGDLNTHRLCININNDGFPTPEDLVDLQVNHTDCDWLRWVLDALDGKSTSWLSRKAESRGQ